MDTIVLGAIELGCIFGILSLGVFLSFRILNIPDLTIDGSFTTGCAVSAVLSMNGHYMLGLLLGVIAGGLCGLVTGLLQTKAKIQPILSGILTMSALYSVNLRILGNQPNVSIYGYDTIFTEMKDATGLGFSNLIVLMILIAVLVVVLNLFFKTQLGLSLRATGDNEAMVRASSINADMMKMIGLVMANALVALSGGVLTQYQGSCAITGGTGMMVIGLASVIVGEAFLHRSSVSSKLISAVIGAVIYRFLLTLALQAGIEANDLKLLSAVLVVIAISLPLLKKGRKYHA